MESVVEIDFDAWIDVGNIKTGGALNFLDMNISHIHTGSIIVHSLNNFTQNFRQQVMAVNKTLHVPIKLICEQRFRLPFFEDVMHFFPFKVQFTLLSQICHQNFVKTKICKFSI